MTHGPDQDGAVTGRLPRSRMWVPLVGVGGWLRLWWGVVRGREAVGVRLRRTGRVVRLRPRTSDRKVMLQVYREHEVRPPAPIEPRWVLDAGANVGITAGYFLDTFPGAKVLALEPDADNLEALRHNAGGRRVRVVQGGLWDADEPLRIANPESESWARQVEPATASTLEPKGTVPGYTLDALCRLAGTDRFDVLKIDVEGAETRVFVDRWKDLIAKAQMVFVEAHGPEAQAQIDTFLASCGFRVTHQHDMTVGYRAG